jgi:hypothetical protein
VSTADRPAEPAEVATSVASACRDAGFVRLVATADGDALAATGVLARALDSLGVPFQASVAEPPASPASGTEADVTVALGRADATADHAVPAGTTPVSETAFLIAQELGDAADPVLALAGATAAETGPSGTLVEAATGPGTGIERRPGVAIPTADVADGLGHSTLVHAPFSGGPERVKAALADLNLLAEATGDADLDEEAHRRIASTVAIRTVGADEASERAAEAVERVLRPAAGGPFETVGGYADVLDSVARERPGTGVALALGHGTREAALSAWRTHGDRAHQALRSATTGRYDGLFVARGSAADLGVTDPGVVPVGTAARLLRDFRSPEPVALFVTDGRAAAATVGDRDLDATMREAADAVDGEGAGSARRAQARFETDTAEFIMAFREAL